MKKFKEWILNSDTIILIVIAIIFACMRISGIVSTDIFRKHWSPDWWDLFGAIMATLISFGVGYGVIIYLFVSWFKFKKTGKW